MNRQRLWTGIQWLVLAVLMALAVQHTWQFTRHPSFSGIDFVQFHVAGQHLRAGGDPQLYSEQVNHELLRAAVSKAAEQPGSQFFRAIGYRQQLGQLELTASPFAYWVFSWFPDVSYDTAHDVFLAISLVAMVVGFLGFGLALRIPRLAFALAVLAVFGYLPALMDLKMGNVSQWQFGMLGVVLLLLHGLPRRLAWSAAAAWLGLCLAFKPTLIVCALFLLVAAMRREPIARVLEIVAAGAIGFLLAVALSLELMPPASWLEWLHALRTMDAADVSLWHGNLSPLFYAVVHGGAWEGIHPLALLLTTGLVLFAATRVVPPVDPAPAGRDTAAWLAAGCLVFLLTSPLAWYYYHVLSLPAILVVTAAALRPPRLQPSVTVVAFLAMAVLALGTYPLDHVHQPSPAMAMLRCVIANLVLLVMTVAVLRQRPLDH